MGANGGGQKSGVTPAELREAERGFLLMLRRKFSAVWIAENANDLLAQANVEYAEWLEKNPPARNPVGWLLTCAYHRAINLLDKQKRRPPTSSLDDAPHLIDSSIQTPEHQVLDHDRQERLRVAMSHLPEKERKLLALVYFEGLSIREAGRKVGWQKSAADRHHTRAMGKLRALVGERSMLSPAPLGLAAWIVARGEGQRLYAALRDAALAPVRKASAIGAESITVAIHRALGLWRRLSPFADVGSATATSGGGRVLGACGVTLASVACGLAASGAMTPLLDSRVDAAPHHRQRQLNAALPTPAPAPAQAPSALPSPELASPRPSARSERIQVKAPEPVRSKARRTPQANAPRASTEQTINEFGVEAGPAPDAAPTTPSQSVESSGSAGASPPSSSGAPKAPSRSSEARSVGSEFGL